MAKPDELKVGVRVKSNIEFSGVPRGTTGTIDEDYGTGVMVCWDLPKKEWQMPPGGLRDGFEKTQESKFLDII